MFSPVILKNWAVVYQKDPLLAIICPGYCLLGNIYGHSKFSDGKLIKTSTIKLINERIIITHSGTIYELVGPASPEYMEYLNSINFNLDYNCPIKFINKLNN